MKGSKEEALDMDSIRFLEACQAAKGMVDSIEDPAYRGAAYGVALLLIVSEANVGKPTPLEPLPPAVGTESKPVKSDTKRRILELRTEGYFKDPRLPAEVRSELRTRGFHHNPADIRMALLRLAQEKALRRLTEGGNNFRYAQP